MIKIDCHTHIVSHAIRDEYFARCKNYALVMQMADSILPNPECLDTVLESERLFLCPVIDLKSPIPERLVEIESMLDKYRVVGLKLFLSYQRGRADDERLFPAYEFCIKHRLSVTFHTGLCSLVLPSDQAIEDSSIEYIAHAAEKFPDVNFVAAHMDDPEFDRCISVMSNYTNIYTDISGAYETGTKEAADIDGAIARFRHATDLWEDSWRYFLYATDFCPPIELGQLDEYDYSIEKMFSPEHFDDIYYKNALRAFPRLSDYIKL